MPSLISLTVIVCTYHRPALLRDCLNSLLQQNYRGPHLFTVLVVDNSSNDLMNKQNQMIMTDFPAFRYCIADKPGLSFARNLGLAESLSSHVAYIDDDATAQEDYITRIMHVIETEPHACFGGSILSYWPFGRPRWLSETFGSKPVLGTTRCTLEQAFVWGGNMIFQTEALKGVSGFPESVGMAGNKVGYGAENYVQIKLRARGCTIGYDPLLVVYHAVLPHKLRLLWHIQSAYFSARDGKPSFKEQYGLKGLLRSFKNLCVQPAKAIYRLIWRKDYYPENFLIDVCKPWAVLAGKIRALSL